MRALLARADEGRVIREGRRVVIAGPVNAGKSSLFNRLAGLDRAIVAATPGTTRDLLVEAVDFGGVPVTLVDTAGLRETDNEVEAEGVRRAERAAEGAAVTLLVLDGSQTLCPEHRDLVRRTERTLRLVVANKADLPLRGRQRTRAWRMSVAPPRGRVRGWSFFERQSALPWGEAVATPNCPG